MEIKKIIAIVLAAVLAIGVIVGCALGVKALAHPAETTNLQAPANRFENAKLRMFYSIYEEVFEGTDEEYAEYADVTIDYLEDKQAFYIHVVLKATEEDHRNYEVEMLLPFNRDNYLEFGDVDDFIDEDNALLYSERWFVEGIE